MLAQRSLPQLLPPMIAAGRQQLQQQQIANKTKLITRNIALSRQNSQLLQQFERQKQQQQQQQQQLQSKRFLSSFSFSTWSAIKSSLHKNFPKGSPPTSKSSKICLVLLPVSTVSCTASLNLSTTTTAATGSKSFEESDSKMSSEEFKNAKTIYEFTVKDTHGNDVSLDKYKGHVVLIVNIASQCGLTKNNYKKLTDLLEKYQEKGLRILNFPCNQFGSQMPEQDGEAMVCHLRDAKAQIGDVFQKVDVNGANAAPIYQFLKAKQGGTLGSAIKWNFTKFLINKEGVPVNRYAPTTDPMDIAKDIEKLL